MKHWLFFLLLGAAAPAYAQKDSAFLFAYSSPASDYQSGLHFARSNDGDHWSSIGNGFSYVRSDYGRWGLEKRMYAPSLFRGPDNRWHCVWQLNDREPLFAYVESADLITWGRQQYPFFDQTGTCLEPGIRYNEATGQYDIAFKNKKGNHYQTTTRDGKTFSPAATADEKYFSAVRSRINLEGISIEGQVIRVPVSVIEKLETHARLWAEKLAREENSFNDSALAGKTTPLTATITRSSEAPRQISDKLIGIFFEDINYAADGGLYAEMLQNRDFEYHPADREYRDSSWNALHSWKTTGAGTRLGIDSLQPLHPNNKHYAVLTTREAGGGLVNTGWTAFR
ncbi:MAG: hypothetical protein QM664_05920 [Flavihumibacter sp.]